MKIIKDLVHDYIEIDEFEETIINTINFQRLKDIKQLTANHVFPSVNHTRFEHSLGVMYLSKKALWKLESPLYASGVEKKKFVFLFKNLTMAALLHDVGHAPFSHLGEKYYRPDEIRGEIDKQIRKKEIKIDPTIFDVGSAHELMSCCIILDKYYDLLKSRDDDYDLDLICRCIVGNKFDTLDMWPENIAIELLCSRTIDMDKLDYLMRDAIMTGLSIPRIDVSRLFRNMQINERTKKLTFRHQAIQVIQNIIDSRDSLFMWVYNHHTVVYTDFLLEFYIKHLIANFENDSQTWADKLEPECYFSVDAVSNHLVSDSDIWNSLKTPLFLERTMLSRYTKNLLPQIFERQFLKPLWKTIYEYNEFIRNHVKDDGLKKDLIDKLCQDSHIYRAYVVRKIIDECSLNHGGIFIIPRSNKFYSLDTESNFTVLLDGHDRNIIDLLPQKDYKRLESVAFYICCKEDKRDEVKKCFIDIANQPLPDKIELEQVTTLKWFEYERKTKRR